jgi:hypothetical protein
MLGVHDNEHGERVAIFKMGQALLGAVLPEVKCCVCYMGFCFLHIRGLYSTNFVPLKGLPIHSAVLQLVRSLFQSDFSARYDLMLPLFSIPPSPFP